MLEKISKKQHIYYVIFILLFIICGTLLWPHANTIISVEIIKDSIPACVYFQHIDNATIAIQYSISRFKECLYKENLTTSTDQQYFMRRLESCLVRHIPIEFREFEIYDRAPDSREPGERMWFLPLHPSYSDDKCIWLTVGIGGVLIGYETEAKRRYPNCKFYGIEADPTSYGNYKQIGTIIPHAVGPINVNKTIVMTIKSNENGGLAFTKQNLKVRAMHELLDEYAHTRLVHFSIFDIEAMEQLLIDELTFDGVFTKENVVFCQIVWELHHDHQYKAVGLTPNKIFTVLKLIANSSYLPIMVSPHYMYHELTLLNMKNEECQAAFKIKERFVKRPIC